MMSGPRRPDPRTAAGQFQRRRPRSTSGSDSALGGEQIEGRNAVLELLSAERRRTTEIWMQQGLDGAAVLDQISDLAASARVPLRVVSSYELDERATSEVHQGVVARAEPPQPVALEELVELGDTAPFLLVLDGVTDPHNLGAVLRSALAAGVTGIVLPKHRSARVTPTVAKAAAGAIEYLSIALVPGIPSALERLRREKIWTVGLDADGDDDLDQVQVLTEPVALVLGAEGDGLSQLARARCDVVARIELVGPVESLNVAAAGAVACFAVARARKRA